MNWQRAVLYAVAGVLLVFSIVEMATSKRTCTIVKVHAESGQVNAEVCR